MNSLRLNNDIFNYGSNAKDEICKKYSSSYLQTQVEGVHKDWDECFSADETDDILAAHARDTQTHTWIFKSPMPYEIIRQLRVSAHALNKETLTLKNQVIQLDEELKQKKIKFNEIYHDNKLYQEAFDQFEEDKV